MGAVSAEPLALPSVEVGRTGAMVAKRRVEVLKRRRRGANEERTKGWKARKQAWGMHSRGVAKVRGTSMAYAGAVRRSESC